MGRGCPPACVDPRLTYEATLLLSVLHVYVAYNHVSLSEVVQVVDFLGLEARTGHESTGEYLNAIISTASSIGGGDGSIRQQVERVDEQRGITLTNSS